MHKYATAALMTATSISLSYILLLARELAVFVARFSAIELRTTIETQLPGPTFVAVRGLWVLIALIAVLGMGAVWVARRQDMAMPGALVAISAQGLIVWAGIACLGYQRLACDGMHAYREGQFDPMRFMTVCGGMFPITFGALVVCGCVGIAMGHRRRRST